MKEEHYQLIGWGCLLFTLAISFAWCMNESALPGLFMDTSERFLKMRMKQFSWLLTFLIIGLPGLMAKRYFDGLAWDAHLKTLPPPDVRESARRSKYIRLEEVPTAAPAVVKLNNISKDQEEFIATCPSCRNFFPAKKGSGEMKCPNCGEVLPASAM